MGKSINLPADTRCVIKGKTTLSDQIDKEYKIVTYIDASFCDECALKILWEWEKIIDDMPRQEKVGFVCLIHSANMPETDIALKNLEIGLPVYYDLNNEFLEDNDLYIDARYRTFLLDQENKIILVGEPLGNPKMWTLYKQTIAKLAANDGQMSSTEDR